MQNDIEYLFEAAKNGDVAAIEQAIAKDRSLVDARSAIENTLLHWAARGHAPLVLTLLEAGADINAQNYEQASPLHKAVCRNCPNIIDILLAAGADLTLKNTDNRTPAVSAGDYGYPPLAIYLQSIADGKTPRPTPESVGLDMNKRMDALEALGKPLGEFTHAERRRKAQRETREAQRQEALRGGGI